MGFDFDRLNDEITVGINNIIKYWQGMTVLHWLDGGTYFNNKDIIDKYYGVKEGICTISPECYVEWANIPHFYYNYYVYSYSTSITASTAISQMILEGKPGAVDNYRRFLGLGGSLPPVEELKVAGVDMTTDEPFTLCMRAMNKALDQMEEILDRMEGK